MNCNEYKKFELGELGEEKFRSHVKLCSLCQNHIAEEKRLISVIKDLKQPVEAPELWNRIEGSLKAEQRLSKSFYTNTVVFRRIAAVLIIAVGLSVYFMSRNSFSDSKLLNQSALLKVVKKEKEYESAISELEKIALVKMTGLDLELMFLYRDRLDTINTQISQCKEAISENPANTHIRRYLLMALQDKQETMKELLEIKIAPM